MNHLKQAAAGLFALLMPAGCSQTAPVSNTCTKEDDGAQIAVTIQAKDENASLESMNIQITFPLGKMLVSLRDSGMDEEAAKKWSNR